MHTRYSLILPLTIFCSTHSAFAAGAVPPFPEFPGAPGRPATPLVFDAKEETDSDDDFPRKLSPMPIRLSKRITRDEDRRGALGGIDTEFLIEKAHLIVEAVKQAGGLTAQLAEECRHLLRVAEASSFNSAHAISCIQDILRTGGISISS